MLYHRKNWLGFFINVKFIKSPQSYKIEKRYTKRLFVFKWGFIVEKNSEEITKGEVYDVEKDEVIKNADIQVSKGTVYKLKKSFPFYEKDFSLTQYNNPHVTGDL